MFAARSAFRSAARKVGMRPTAGRLPLCGARFSSSGAEPAPQPAPQPAPLPHELGGYTGAFPGDYPPIKKPEVPTLKMPSLIEGKKKPLKYSRRLEIDLGIDRGTISLPVEWLRDNCTCAKCVNPDSGQKSFSSAEIAPHPVIEHMSRTEDGGVRIVWQDGGMRRLRTTNPREANRWAGPHESVYSFEYLASLDQPPAFEKYRQWPLEWLGASFGPMTIQYSEWMAGGAAFEEALLALDATGLIFLKNVPKSEKSVEDVGSAVGNLYNTFYGYTWDVRSKKNAENVAYTNDYLGLHQDLMYKSDPPRIQILHCLENSCAGGESMYSDGRAAARRLTTHEYVRLARWPVRYGYDRNGFLYNYERPVFSGDLEGAGVRLVDMLGRPHQRVEKHDVNGTRRWRLAWSPPFQTNQISPIVRPGDPDSLPSNYVSYRRAATRFQEYLEHRDTMLEYRMEPSDCALFDNWRVLHGRREFDVTSGDRWLKGAYLDHQVFDSKVRVTLRNRERLGLWSPSPMPAYPRLETRNDRKKAFRSVEEEEDGYEEEGGGPDTEFQPQEATPEAEPRTSF